VNNELKENEDKLNDVIKRIDKYADEFEDATKLVRPWE
jgi:hypothetical protein